MRRIFDRFACLALLVCSGCSGPRWGEGAVELPDTIARVVGGIERHVDEVTLTRVGQRLTEATSALREQGFTPDGVERARFTGGSVPVTRFRLELAGPVLLLRAEVGAAVLPWTTDDGPEACQGRVELGPGQFVLPIGFASDKQGRIQAVPPERAMWEGPLAVRLERDTSTDCPGLDAGFFAEGLTRRIPGWLVPDVIGPLPTHVGFGLAASLGAPAGAETRNFRAHLRARTEDPVIVRDGTLVANFELAVQTDPAPCLAPFAFAPGRIEVETTGDTRTNEGTGGLRIPVNAVGAFVEAAVLGGALCGRQTFSTTRIFDVEAWRDSFDDDSLSEVAFELQPHAPPTIAMDAAGRLVWDAGRVDVDLSATWAGARWRLATLETEVEIAIALHLDGDGMLVGELAAITSTLIERRGGLLTAPDVDAADGIVATIVSELVDGRVLLAWPQGLAPTNGARVTGSDGGVTWFVPDR